MRRVISDSDEQHYAYMLKTLNSIGGINLNCNWLITDIEAYPQDMSNWALIYNKDYLFLSNKELIEILEKDDFQWIWAVFSAIPNNYSESEVLKYRRPTIEEDKELTTNHIKHPLATTEILVEDAVSITVLSKDDTVIDGFKSAYKNSREI